MFAIRALADSERQALRQFWITHWGADYVVARGRLITTNDNTHALRFYQKLGFELTALYCHAVDLSRKLKPSIPETGQDGIPIRDEIELQLRLSSSTP